MTDRIEARLVYDTKAQPLSPGVRAVVQRARRVLKLAGQVLDEGMPIEGAAVALHGPAADQVQRETDEDGEFLIPSLAKGEYCLEIGTRAGLLSVTPLDIECVRASF